MSLLYGDDFADSTTLPNSDYIFCSLFKNAPVVSAENLVLPATTLKPYCYRAMFSGCTTLTKAPELPATTLAEGCYWYMFQQCPITKAPVLKAATLVKECYGHMFENCAKINSVKCLATSGFNQMAAVTDMLNCTAASGTFYYAKEAKSNWESESIVPTGWAWVVVEQ